MTNTQANVWVVRAGKYGEANELFLKGHVATGWQLGNLSTLPPDKEAFKKAYLIAYPNVTSNVVTSTAGRIFNFVHEVKEGDVVIYPSKIDHLVHIGKVIGPYEYNPSLNKEFPHIRPVRWRQHLPRVHFSRAALYAIGGLQVLFKVGAKKSEFLTLVYGQSHASDAGQQDKLAHGE